jgi:hypothetical protein
MAGTLVMLVGVIALVVVVSAVAGAPLTLVAPVLLAVVAGIALRAVSTPDEPSTGPDRQERRRTVVSGGVADHPVVDRTGEHAAGAPVYETDVDGRPVTAAATHTGDGRAVALRTPLELTRRGVGFAVRGRGEDLTVEREPNAVQSGDTGDLLAGVETTLADVTVGHLRVDDRVGVVEHRLEELTGGGQFRRQAEALAEVATAVERAADDDTAVRERATGAESG